MSESIERPDGIDEEHLEYLDELQESGACNMFAAGNYLMDEFGIGHRQATVTVQYWMASWNERHES